MIDLHNHMLPGLDDGPPDWKSSLEMARIAWTDGIQHTVCTPHWVQGCYENSRPRILRAVLELRKRLKEENIPLKVHPGAELHLDFELPQRIRDGEVITLNDTGRYALIELPTHIVPRNLKNFFWDLLSLNVTPVISHPERNLALLQEPMRLFRWVEMGVLTQVTASSILGRFGPEIRKFTRVLLEHDLVHVVASDAHSPRARTPRLSGAREEIGGLMGEDLAKELLWVNPGKILKGIPISPRTPLTLEGVHRASHFSRFFSFLGLGSRRAP